MANANSRMNSVLSHPLQSVVDDEEFTPINKSEQFALSLDPLEKQTQDDDDTNKVIENVSKSVRNAEFKSILMKIEETLFGIVADLSGKTSKSIVDVFFDPARLEGLIYIVGVIGFGSIVVRGLRD